MGRRGRWAYLGGIALAIAGYPLTPDDTWLRASWQLLVGSSVAAVLVLAGWPLRAQSRRVWWWLAAGVGLYASGVAVEVKIGRLDNGLAIATASAAVFLLVVIRMARLLRQVERQARTLQELSRVDPLTGLPNRRAWIEEISAEMQRARRADVRLAVAILDLDRFKRFNDTHGRPAGDRLLKSASAGWLAEIREVDRLARWGGEEFVLLMPGVDEVTAADIVARLRAATPLGQTFSAGIAVWDFEEFPEELVKRADEALYRAKRAGRNRSEMAGYPTETG